MIIGNGPWKCAAPTDGGFYHIFTGRMRNLLYKWDKLAFVNNEIVELFNRFFRYEHNRITLSELKRNKWIYS